MTIGEKIAKLRKENNITQEQLAEKLGVSRQAISKWESNATYPETDKLIRISERKSQRTWRGLPLWQIGRNAKAVVAVGLNAKGILAIGLMARGLFAVGLLSIGLVSLGLLSIALLAFGTLSVGILALGAIAVGIAAIGGVALGCFALGGVSIGFCSVGGLAIGRYFALGDYANGEIALGKTEAVGALFEKLGKLSADEVKTVMAMLDERIPVALGWANALVKLILRIVN